MIIYLVFICFILFAVFLMLFFEEIMKQDSNYKKFMDEHEEHKEKLFKP